MSEELLTCNCCFEESVRVDDISGECLDCKRTNVELAIENLNEHPGKPKEIVYVLEKKKERR